MADVKSLIANMLATGKRPRWDEMPEGDFLPKEALGSALDAEMSYDGSHPRQQEQEAINAFRGYGPQMLMDAFIPGYGAGGDAKAASEAYGEGRYGAAAGNALMAAMDFVPVLGALPAAAKGIRAFHGSPHDFDRFDMSKIGTGEGAQAYGHGLYFAENERVAQGYRDDLSQMNFSSAKRALDNFGGDADAAIQAARDKIARLSELPPSDRRTAQIGINEQKIANLTRYKETGDMGLGRMYEVNINADPEAFLDWDKPLSEQPAKVRDSVARAGLPLVRESKWYGPTRTAGNAPFWTNNGAFVRETERGFEYGTGSPFDAPAAGVAKTFEEAQALSSVEPTPLHGMELLVGQNRGAAEQALRDAGIPGIKYLDAGSRGAGDGSRNYVVFDDRLITILRKYGIGGLIAGGGAYALTDAEYAQAAELLAQDGMNTGAQ